MYNIIMPDKKSEVIMMPKKLGRPTDNPRPNKLSIRISDADKELLENYCERENVNKTEAISRGINLLDKK